MITSSLCFNRTLSCTVIHGHHVGCHVDTDPECISADAEDFLFIVNMCLCALSGALLHNRQQQGRIVSDLCKQS